MNTAANEAKTAGASGFGLKPGQAQPGIRQDRHVLQWHITHKCNLRCAHCYQDEYQAEMSRDELFAVLDKYDRFLKSKGLQGHINLTGGEPVAHPDFFPLAEEIRHRGISFAVLTNGTLLDEDSALRLAELRPLFVQISMDGGPNVHDKIRGENAMAGALRAIDYLKAFGVRVLVSFTAQRANRFQLDNVARICKVHNVDKLWWDRVIIPKEEDKEHQMLTGLQFRVLARKAGWYAHRNTLADGEHYVHCVRGLQFLYADGVRPYTCAAGHNLLVMKADGDLMPCRRLPYVIGNIRDGELADIIDGSDLMKELREAPIPEACAGCKHAESCRGGSKCVTCAKTGTWRGKDPDCRMK